ncbi:MAG TPA: hypothetical protein VJ302_35170, partial [Blastocatellia bacterium]|nr:hypothetical protein [Blastocatellia bacterium]
SYIYPFDEAALRDFAYYFADRNLPADYFTAMVKWIGQLQAAVNQWRELWKDSSQRLPPKLDFIGDSDLIHDSRSGSATEYSVGPAGRALLNYLAKPARIDDLTQVFSDKYGRDLDRRLADLREKGLLFEEGDRLMSLVLGGERKTQAPASS